MPGSGLKVQVVGGDVGGGGGGGGVQTKFSVQLWSQAEQNYKVVNDKKVDPLKVIRVSDGD